MKKQKDSLFNYQHTMYACFIGYIVQAIVNNFLPLLFLNFHRIYGIPLTKIAFFVTVNFGIQLCVDLLSVTFVDRIGYRASMLIAHTAAAGGMILLCLLPDWIGDPYTGLMIAVVFYAVGGGLLEVLVSPIMEACPTDNKAAAMSLLHSFYCWGYVGVVLLSTIFFAVFGIEKWKILALCWAVVPLINLCLFSKVPISEMKEEGESETPVKRLFKEKLFWIFVLLMICSGACEQAVSQWASTFAEQGLGVSKTVGDLAGPMFFAVMMGISRTVYGTVGERLPLKKCMIASSILCLFSYLIISLAQIPFLGLLGCGICGFSVGILWPGTFSLASLSLPGAGTALFSFLALGGDIGCSVGPTYVGILSDVFSQDLKKGILCAVIFPLMLIGGLWIQGKNIRSKK